MDDFKSLLRELALGTAAIAIGLSLFAAVAVPFIWFQAHQEAAAFNRFTTGPKATTWDAIWVELRVEADR
jgi:hypothetical protein